MLGDRSRRRNDGSLCSELALLVGLCSAGPQPPPSPMSFYAVTNFLSVYLFFCCFLFIFSLLARRRQVRVGGGRPVAVGVLVVVDIGHGMAWVGGVG